MRRIVISLSLVFIPLGEPRAEYVASPLDCVQTTAPRAGNFNYRVLGPRKTKTITICSQTDKRRCRPLVIHKFDVNCHGRRTSWDKIARRIMTARRIKHSANNRALTFRVGRRGFAAFNVRCDKPTDAGKSRDRELKSACRRDRATPAMVVRLPKGYAPLVELGAQVIADAPPLVARLRPIKSANAKAARVERKAAMALPGELSDTIDNMPQPTAATRIASGRVLASGSADTAITSVLQPNQAAAPQQAELQLATATKTVPQAAKSWTETLVDAAGARATAPDSVQQSIVATVLGLALITSLLSGIGWFATQQLLGARNRRADPYQVILRREVTELARPDAQMCGELCRTGQNLIGEIHTRVDEIQGAAPLRRVLMREVRSMEQFLATTVQNAPDDPRDWRRMRLRLQRVVTDLIRLKDITDGARRSLTSKIISDDLPRDKREAYEVLGANPEASEKILKRLVDALRATWHPDLAQGEDDRELRERRIKQINVAWDLICEKRVEA